MSFSHVCLIEDDDIMGEALSDRLNLEGFHCNWFKTGQTARDSLEKDRYCVVISDINLPDTDGEALFESMRSTGANLPPYIFMTGYGAIDRAVRLLKLGADDYLTKPVDIRALIEKVRTICARNVPDAARRPGQDTLGISSAMRHIAALLPRLSVDNITVLITGESGVGKEVVARALHGQRDPDWKRPFITVNCGAITETLLEAEMFGYVKGAYTGAIRDKKGYFEQADGGTLFLDEVGEMPLSMQVKLLRVIQERKLVRVGAEALIPVSINLVCATNRNLKKMVEAGDFREDLYYRIHVLEVKVPALRERKEDILWLASLILEAEATQHGSQRRELSPAAQQALLEQPWKGNIRELKSCLERACILSSQAVLTPETLFGNLEQAQPDSKVVAMSSDGKLREQMRRLETQLVRSAVEAAQGDRKEAAQSLGISLSSLYSKLGTEPN